MEMKVEEKLKLESDEFKFFYLFLFRKIIT